MVKQSVALHPKCYVILCIYVGDELNGKVWRRYGASRSWLLRRNADVDFCSAN